MDLNELEDDQAPTDFRRANGAPLVRSLDGAKWLRYSRPSGFGHDLDDESALTIWKIDRAMEGVATTPSLAASIAAHVGERDGKQGERREKAINLGKGEEAADLGTALHAMAHRLESDPGFRAPEPHSSDLAAYLGAIDAAGLESTHIEVNVCSDRWKAAGTTDRIYRTRRELRLPDGSTIPPGTSFIGDLKTGKRLDYNLPGFAIQLAIYCDGCFYDVATDTRSPLPEQLHTAYGILVHLPAGKEKATLWWVDLEVGRVGAALVQRVREWRKRDDFSAPFIFPESDEVAVLQSPIYDLEHPVLDEPEPEQGLHAWVEAMLPWCQERINLIGALSEPRAMLLRKWPPNIPPFRTATPSPTHLSQILDLVTQIESAYSLPFPPGDPRLEWDRGVHKLDVIRSNEPRSIDE
ncbi:MAG TPA: hypothetical protein VFQ26_01000 [Nitrospiraceae bacterium]|nr:hypothetical protein [Nitrospiraceae bacterium]